MTGTLACRRHRPVLVDFVDRRERGPRTPAALDHLARCERCEQEMAEYALTIVALRRAGREIAAFPVPRGHPAPGAVAGVAPRPVVLAPAGRRPAHLCGDRGAGDPAPRPDVHLAG